MPGEFSNKVAVVTGGSRGIGREIAVELARAGAQTVIVSSSAENLAAGLISAARNWQEGRMAWPTRENEWADRAARHLKAELKRADMTYEVLALKLRKHGFNETKASIANKLARTTLSAHFFLASLVAMGREQVTLSDI
jgi:NAD(P)-dependent dehydrogenase (short-subunit alcohol dehydrogenase family)